jgi:hypothetical protein
VKLAKGYSPLDDALAVGCENAQFHRVGEGPWSGTVTLDGRHLDVEELATNWRVTDGSDRSVSGTSLGQLLKKASSSSGPDR